MSSSSSAAVRRRSHEKHGGDSSTHSTHGTPKKLVVRGRVNAGRNGPPAAGLESGGGLLNSNPSSGVGTALHCTALHWENQDWTKAGLQLRAKLKRQETLARGKEGGKRATRPNGRPWGGARHSYTAGPSWDFGGGRRGVCVGGAARIRTETRRRLDDCVVVDSNSDSEERACPGRRRRPCVQHRGRPHPTHSLHGARGAMGTHRARRSSSSSSSKTPTPRRDIPADFNRAEDRCLSLLVRSRPLPSPRKPAGTSPGQRTDQVEEASGRLDHARWRQAGWPDGVPAVALRRGCVRVRDRLVGLARGWWWWSLFLSSRAGRSVHTRSVFFEVRAGGRNQRVSPVCDSHSVSRLSCWSGAGAARNHSLHQTRGERDPVQSERKRI